MIQLRLGLGKLQALVTSPGRSQTARSALIPGMSGTAGRGLMTLKTSKAEQKALMHDLLTFKVQLDEILGQTFYSNEAFQFAIKVSFCLMMTSTKLVSICLYSRS